MYEHVCTFCDLRVRNNDEHIPSRCPECESRMTAFVDDEDVTPTQTVAA